LTSVCEETATIFDGWNRPKLVVSERYVLPHDTYLSDAFIRVGSPGIVQIMNANESEIKPEPAEIAAIPAFPSFPTRYLRFGSFQVDLQREDLGRDGERIRLQGKVYQTLLILLSRAGSVVTREEVRRHLWPENPDVNFDANVNTTMNKLRQALGDSPENPAYIETIPRRGYCFLAEVEFADSPIPGSTKSAEGSAGRAADAARSALKVQRPYALPVGFRVATLVLAGMIVGALLVLAWFSYNHSRKALHAGVEAERVLGVEWHARLKS
jgi:DNA-binding winged helix-turn-helix (wHTH) protein